MQFNCEIKTFLLNRQNLIFYHFNDNINVRFTVKRKNEISLRRLDQTGNDRCKSSLTDDDIFSVTLSFLNVLL